MREIPVAGTTTGRLSRHRRSAATFAIGGSKVYMESGMHLANLEKLDKNDQNKLTSLSTFIYINMIYIHKTTHLYTQ